MNLRSVLLAIVLALVVASCSTSDEVTGPTDTATTAVTTAVTGAPETTAPASTAPPTTRTPTTGPPVSAAPGLPEYTPVYQPTECRFTLPEGYGADCGYLVVPENRADLDAGDVYIHVAVFPALTPTPAPDPVVYLEGGPGGHALQGLEFSFTDRFAPFLARGDLIVFDQRGAGMSTPSLACPEVRDAEIDLLDEVLTPQQYTARETAALTECRDRLVDAGVDLSQYNSAANAADLADLQATLGIPEVNLYGISYGTRLALTAMRDNPEGIRSVILDSTVPLDAAIPAQIPSSANRAFDTLFGSCAGSSTCAAAYPDLRGAFDALRAQLDADPATIEITDFLTGSSHPAVLTGEDLTSLVFQSLYSELLIPVLPDIIFDAVDGRYGGLSQLASVFFTNGAFISLGMHLAVQCSEEYAFSTVADVENEVARFPYTADLFGDVPGEFAECALWNSGQADPIENAPVTSPIPTLVMSGEFDPITPPAYGERAAATLSNSFFFEYPGLGHGVSAAHPCPLAMTLAFLDDPTAAPDSTCIDEMAAPAFIAPGAINVNLVQIEEEFRGLKVSGVVPEGWDSAGFGQWTAPGLGDTAIVQQARTAEGSSIEAMADSIADFFDITSWTTTQYQEARTWDVYEGTDGDLAYLMGLTEDDGTLLLVILATQPDLLADYQSAVFTPALDAIRAG